MKTISLLGCFDSEIDAAKAYFKAATEYSGAFTRTNLEPAQCQAQ